MFKPNETHSQTELFGLVDKLNTKQSKRLTKSIEHFFYTNLFLKIDERKFAKLYSKKASRPNVPVNQLVGALILKHIFNWTYEELFKNLNFNILTRYSLGIRKIEDNIFAEASLFNFQSKLVEHMGKTKEDLIEQVLNELTLKQQKTLQIKTDIQRCDSFLIGSNIVDYSRLRLLVEVLKRLERELSENHLSEHKEIFDCFLNKTSSQYIYKIEKSDLSKQYELMGKFYHEIYQKHNQTYKDNEVFQIFKRVYFEHFKIIEKKIVVKDSEELGSNILMSPDDTEATFRQKGRRSSSKGYVGHLTETANPENNVQLITDVEVAQNNVDDGQILNGRLRKMVKKTPELKELFTDGLYGNLDNDKILNKNEIQQYQTGIRGRPSYGGIEIEEVKLEDETVQYWVSCKGGQRVKGIKKKKWSAKFDTSICEKCPLAEKCTTRIYKTKKGKQTRSYYFGEEKILRQKRLHAIKKLPEAKRKLRANVEATIRLASKGMKNGKVRVREKLKVKLYLMLTCIGINLKRVYCA